MVKDDSLYIRHILDSLRRIESYSKNLSHHKFISEPLFQDAMIRQLEIVGEATKRLSKEFIMIHPTIPWADISGMRNKLIHDYFGVDLEMVWKTVNEDVPELRKYLEKNVIV